jgi:hypothetical protein
MKNTIFKIQIFVLMFALLTSAALAQQKKEDRRLSLQEYTDKMKGGWIGQMAGVGWGGPTEFKFNGAIIPEDKMPTWTPEKINQFRQDDIYVEMTFFLAHARSLRSRRRHPPGRNRLCEQRV